MKAVQKIAATLLLLLAPVNGSIFEELYNGILLPRLQCYMRFGLFQFDIADFGSYDKYFGDDSKMTLAEAGTYSGADGIKEYVKFVFSEFSPYFAVGDVANDQVNFQGFDSDAGECQFTVIYNTEYKMEETKTGSNDVFNEIHMVKLFFNIRERYIPTINVFYPEDYLNLLFGTFFDSTNTRDFICGVMEGPCATYITAPADCSAVLEALPNADEGARVDGNSQGCRALHAVFAETNPSSHCPHISFTPEEDPSGSIKCQEAGSTLPEDLFDDADLDLWTEFAIQEGIDPAIGHNHPLTRR